MKTQDFAPVINSDKLAENLVKQFNTKVNLNSYDREQLEDIRNKLRTKIFQQEGSSKFNDLLTNETYQKDKAMLELLNTRIKEMLGEQMKQLRDKMDQLNEAKKSKPDFLDLNKNGNKTEPMKKAAKDAKVKEGFPTVDDARAEHEKNKTTGKFDKKELAPGVTRYTRKASTFTDGGDDSDTKAAKKKAKKAGGGELDEQVMGNQMNMFKDFSNNVANGQDAKQAALAVSKDYRMKFEVAASDLASFGKQNPRWIDTPELANAVKTLQQLGAANQAFDPMIEASHQEKTTMKHLKNPTAGEKKAAKDIKPGVAAYDYRGQVEEGAAAGYDPETQARIKAATPQQLSQMAQEFGGDPGHYQSELKLLQQAKAELSGQVDEGPIDAVKKIGKKVASGVNRLVGHGSDEDMRRDVQRKAGVPQTGKKPNFADKIAKDAGKRYGSKAAGERVAGAVRNKLAKQGKLEESQFKHNVRFVNESIGFLLQEDEEAKAKTITAAGDIVNDFTGWMQRIGQYQTKAIIELADSIRAEFGAAESEAFKQKVGPSLATSLETLTQQREILSNAVAELAGEAVPETPMGMEPNADMDAGLDIAKPDSMNTNDEFAASDAAAGGAETAGRELRESRAKRRARKLAESHSILTKLAR